VGQRYSDKRPEIHKDAITGLGRIYGQYMGQRWKKQWNEDRPWIPTVGGGGGGGGGGDDDLLSERLGWVPNLVLFFAVSKANSSAVKARTAQLLDDYLLPNVSDLVHRSQAGSSCVICQPCTRV
jgi:hypothetical protein